MSSPPTIAVVGPTGFTGRLVVAALADRGASIRLVGRSLERLTAVAFEHREASTRAVPVLRWEAGALADAIGGCGAVISCAGPFADVGRPVVEAAVAARVPYCDSTGEQTFIRDVFEEFDAPAHAAGVPLVPGFGFDFVPGDLGAAIAGEGMEPLARIDVVYAMRSAVSSVGTRRSGVRVIAGAGSQWIDGRLQERRVGAMRRTVHAGFADVVAGSFPGGEPLMVPRHLRVDTVVSYISLPGALNPASRTAHLLVGATRLPGVAGVLQRVAARGPEGPDARARASPVGCHVEALSHEGRRRCVLIEGADAYGFTAAALSELSLRMARAGARPVGACAPAQVVRPEEFLTQLGYRVGEGRAGARA